MSLIMADLSIVDRAANQLRSPLTQSRGREGPALRSSSNMAGFRGDVMGSWSGSGSGSATDPPSLAAVPASEQQKPRKRRRAFCLTRMKSRSSSGKQHQHQPAANNNNTPFMIHCQIGKEIKHICSNCRGAEPPDGEGTRSTLLLQRQGGRGGGGGGGGGGVFTPLLLNEYCHLPVTAPCLPGESAAPGAGLRSALNGPCIDRFSF